MFWALVSIVLIFFLSLSFKRIFSNLCSICAAVFVTWLIGILFFSNQNFVEIDPLVLSMLMGGSAVGFLYYLGSALPEKFLVFRLPYLITAFAFFYFIIKLTFDLRVALLVLAVWAIFGLVFLFRNKATGNWFKKIIECCKNW